MKKENNMKRKYNNADIDAMTERYIADRNDMEAINFLKDAAMESEDNRLRIRRNLELWFSSSTDDNKQQFDKAAAYERFCNHTATYSLRKKRKTRLFKVMKVAAAIALIAALPWMGYRFADNWNSSRLACVCVSTPKGSISEVTLPDGSKVWLNANSRIEYTNDFGTDNRNVKLTGEACFDVKKNKRLPFCVNSKSASLKVLGTKFTFRDYPEDNCMTVQLIRGHVDIMSSKTGRHMEMLKDEKMTINKTTGSMDKRKTDASKSDSWIHGELFFDEMPMEQIAKVLERTYNVRIEVAPQMRNKAFYLSFNSAGQTISDVLKTMAETNRMKFRKTEDGRYIIY